MGLANSLSYVWRHEAFRAHPWRTLFRLLVWRLRSLRRTPKTMTVPRWNLKLQVPSQWKGISKLLYVFREHYEPELLYLEQCLKPGMVILDVGANFGIYSLICARLIGPQGRGLAFEPARETQTILRENLSLNQITNIQVMPVALSDQAGTARLFHFDDPGRHSMGGEIGQAFEDVPTETLDRVVSQENLDRVDFLKIDTEGADEKVLRGAEGILKNFRPIVLFEVNPEGCQRLGLNPRGAWDYLIQLGYAHWVFQGGQLMVATWGGTGGNVVSLFENSK